MNHPNPADREDAQAWARTLLNRKDWILIDTETTGLGSDAEAVQIGVLAPSGHVLLDVLLKPSRPIPAEATAVHGITDEHVAAAIQFYDLWPVLKRLFWDTSIIAYNAAYDRRILFQTAERTCPDDLADHRIFRWDCAMLQYARYVGEWNRFGNYKWPKLPPVPGERAHGAIADCRATLALIQMMAAELLVIADEAILMLGGNERVEVIEV